MANLFGRMLFPLFTMLRAILSPVAFGVLAVVEQGGKIVLVRQTYATGWHLPGGGVHRGEPPAQAVLRELREEIGLTQADPPELIGLYTRRVWLATNLNAVYRVPGAVFAFKPNFEISEIMLADPAALPNGVTRGVRRRLAELAGTIPKGNHW
jgi:8-oxo-dGTP pyrophosphatase MutT (NUDIX family)